MALDGDLDPVKLRETRQQSLGELFKELAADTGLLVKKEVELAKTEMAGKAKVVVTTAIAREMVGFIWAIARAATAAPT